MCMRPGWLTDYNPAPVPWQADLTQVGKSGMTLPAVLLNAADGSNATTGRHWMRHLLSHVTLQEVSGALGDLGSFLPIVVALVPAVHLDLGTTLALTGAYNIASGLTFGIPMCVQPMSTIAAIALTAPGLTLPEIVAAGAFVSSCVLLLGVTRVMDLVTRVTPPALVAAIQLAVGLKLAQQGVRQVLMHTDVHAAPSPALPVLGSATASRTPAVDVSVWRPFGGVEGWGLGAAVLLYLLLVTLPPSQQQQATRSQQHRLPEHEEEQQDREQRRLGWRPWQQQEQGGRQRQAAEATDVEQQQQQQQPLLAGHLGCMSSSAAPGCLGNWYPSQAEQQQQAGEQWDGITVPGPAHAAGGRGGGVDGLSSRSDTEVHEGGCIQPSPCSSSSSSSSSSAKSPAALLVVVLGLVLTCVSRPGVLSELKLGPSRPHLILPSRQEWLEGVRKAGLAQLPTTALNSVVAVSALAHQLYPTATPAQAAAWRPSAVAVSVGVMNLLGVWWGTLPCCHGAGGLAAQHKFGARSGAAPVLLGVAKLALGLCFGSSLFQLLQQFPGPMLGSLLTVAGLELARSVHRLHLDAQGFGEMVVTVAVMMGLGDVAKGFACGVVLHVALLLQQWAVQWVHHRH